jgi:hypothetical protein
MKCFKYNLLIIMSILLLAFPSCEGSQEKIEINLEPDYSGMLAAIRGMDKSLADKLALIESAAEGGLENNSKALALIKEFIASLQGSIEEKLSALATAMQMQAASLETKIALVEEAARQGLVDLEAQQKLLLQALSSFSGTAQEKLSAVKAAVLSQASDIQTKLGLVEAAVKDGIADGNDEYALIAAIIEGLGKTVTEKLAAIEAVAQGQAATLSSKLALIEGAVSGGFADESTQLELIRTALSSLEGTLEQKYAALEAAVNNQNRNLDTKMTLIDQAVNTGATGKDSAMDLIEQALTSLGGSLDTKIAAINSVIGNQTTSLETKMGLISSALEQGLLAETDAVNSMKTALDTSISDIDSDLAAAMSDILTSVSDLSAKVTPEELAKAFKGIIDAINSHSQSKEELLTTIQQVLSELEDMLVQPAVTLTIIGEPSYTVVKQQNLALKISVTPAKTVLSESNLKLTVVETKQFFKNDGTEADHFSIKSLVEDPSAEGQYIVTLSSDAACNVWDESTLRLEHNCGTATVPQYVSSNAFQVTMLPTAIEALDRWVYPNATLCAVDTIYSSTLQGRYETDTLGVIYYVFDKAEYRQKNGTEKRSYTTDILDAISFVPNSGAAPVKFNWNKKNKDELHNSSYVTFCPDTTGSLQWRNIETVLYEKMDVKGTLFMTDTCGHQSSVPVNLSWYNQHELDLTLNVSVNDSHFDKTGEQPRYTDGLAYAFKYVGLDDTLLNGCRYRFDYKAQALTQQDIADGYIPVKLSWTGSGREAVFIFDKNTTFSAGQQYRVRGRIRLKMQPLDTTGFDPRQLLLLYCITIKITS